MRAVVGWAAVSRLVVATMIAAVLQLASAMVAAHPGDGCDDELCSTLQCDMAAGNGCGSLCAPAAAAPAGAKPEQRRVPNVVIADLDSGPGLELPERPFRPPAHS